MVRLRPPADDTMPSFSPSFPFHNGSIETTHSCPHWANLPKISIPQWFDWDGECRAWLSQTIAEFPFHNGSIETFLCLRRLSQDPYFHSTMVRLRLLRLIEWLIPRGDFHSTMVRLRQGSGGVWLRQRMERFPFHNGSIETQFSHCYFSLFLSSI